MERKSKFMVWWRLLRPFTLVAGMIPVFVGSFLALTEGRFHLGRFIAFLLASVLIQSATNMFNEYFDYVRGLDTEEHVGIAGTIVRDGIHPRTVLTLGWLFAGTAVVIGLYISGTTSWWVFLTGLLCIGVAFIYSGGPIPLAYTPFGELAAGLTMGPVMILLVYYTQTLSLSLRALWVALPIGILIGAILLGNNIRDLEADRTGGRRTLPILLGRGGTAVLMAALFVVADLITLLLVITGLLPIWTLLVLLTTPSAYRTARLFFVEREPTRLHPAVKGVAQHLARFGLLLVAGLLLSIWF